jgi:hypothetical protein
MGGKDTRLGHWGDHFCSATTNKISVSASHYGKQGNTVSAGISNKRTSGHTDYYDQYPPAIWVFSCLVAFDRAPLEVPVQQLG